MTKKKAAAAAADVLGGDGNLDDIPAGLLVENRVPLTAEQQAKVDAMKPVSSEDKKVVPFQKPKGMSMEEWEAQESRDRQKKRDATKERLSKLPPKAKKAAPPSDSFHLSDVASELGIPTKIARAIARKNKGALKPLEIGKYLFAKSSRTEVLKTIKDGLPGGKSLAMPSKKKVVIPSDGVWSGKAKKAKKVVDAPAPVAKEEARAEAKAAMKGRKKIPVEGGAMFIKKREKVS